MNKYRKKPVIVEAIQWTGENLFDIENFIPCEDYWLSGKGLNLLTIDGNMFIPVGDYITKNEKGYYTRCRKDTFEKTFEKVGSHE
jgi:hypothetical protein